MRRRRGWPSPTPGSWRSTSTAPWRTPPRRPRWRRRRHCRRRGWPSSISCRATSGARAGRRTRRRGWGTTPLTDIVQGFADLAALRGASAEAAFRRALRQESQNPLALLGLGLAQIKQGHLEQGRGQIEAAVALDPSSSLLRSYLGEAYVEELRDEAGGEAVGDRQGSRPDRSDAVVLRCHPAAARQPAGRGPARHRAVDRAQRESRAVPLAAAAAAGPGGTWRQPRPDL